MTARATARKPRISDAMRRVLENVAAGKPADHHCRTMSDHGGLTATLAALHRHGLRDWETGEITDAGRAAIAPAAPAKPSPCAACPWTQKGQPLITDTLREAAAAGTWFCCHVNLGTCHGAERAGTAKRRQAGNLADLVADPHAEKGPA